MKLKVLPRDLTVANCRFRKGPTWMPVFFFPGRTDGEILPVFLTDRAPADTIAREDGRRGLRIKGTLDFSRVGILSKISGDLSGAGGAEYD